MVYLNPIIRKSTLLESIYSVTLVRNSGVWSNSSNLNNRFLRERGMASNPKMEYQFVLHFPKPSFLREGREKSLPS